jgi:hypothetical protein
MLGDRHTSCGNALEVPVTITVNPIITPLTEGDRHRAFVRRTRSRN